jgi:hypothetical protein
MPHNRLEHALKVSPISVSEPESAIAASRGGDASGRLVRAVAAFLLGLTLGVSGILIGRSALHDPAPVAAPALRR